MPTKAELQNARNAYHGEANAARMAVHHGRFKDAVHLAVGSLEHIDAMMQYERKYENKEFESVGTIDIILRYAPLLFDSSSLDAVDAILKKQKRIDKYASADLAANVVDARKRMSIAYRIWKWLDGQQEVSLDDLNKDSPETTAVVKSVIHDWATMGIVAFTGNSGTRMRLVTQLSRSINGKCPNCGAVVLASKSKLLSEAACPRCQKVCSFLLIEA